MKCLHYFLGGKGVGVFVECFYALSDLYYNLPDSSSFILVFGIQQLFNTMVQKLLYVCVTKNNQKTQATSKYTKNPHNTENFKLAKHLNTWFEWQMFPIILLTFEHLFPSWWHYLERLGGKGTGEESAAGELWDEKPHSIPSSLSALGS